jgi:hypothetical protein
MKTMPVIAAINGNRLAWTERDHATEKGVDAADIGVQFGKMKYSIVADGDFAIALAQKQLIGNISYRDLAITRELKTAEDVHGAETCLRPQSLATQ